MQSWKILDLLCGHFPINVRETWVCFLETGFIERWRVLIYISVATVTNKLFWFIREW